MRSKYNLKMDILKEIKRDIIKNNSLLQELLETEEKIVTSEKHEEISFDHIVDEYSTKIQQNPYKKTIYLREFLELFQDRVSEKDKDIILQYINQYIENQFYCKHCGADLPEGQSICHVCGNKI